MSPPRKHPAHSQLRLRLVPSGNGGGAPLPTGQEDAARPASAPRSGKESRMGPHIGVDEAGRGCLAGPVIAAAVLFPARFRFRSRLPGLADSKKLSEKERTRLAGAIRDTALAFGLGLAWQDEIDSVNILNATFRAMSRAVLALSARLAGNSAPPALPLLLIDGNKTIPEREWAFCVEGLPPSALAWEQYLPAPFSLLSAQPPVLPPQRCLVRGDDLEPAISAASILAKSARDSLMLRLDALFPGYGLAGHKGYGTKSHLAALAEKGPCRLHRMSFRPVAADPAAPLMLSLL